MHHAWEIYDIRELILEQIEPGDLARLAQTCTALFDIATDKLWSEIHSVLPLLSCLAPDFRRRPLEERDILRLNLYASKVRNLHMEGKSIESVIHLPAKFNPHSKQSKADFRKKSWEEVWDEIATLRGTTQLMPNLRRLRINNVAEELVIPLIGISGSNLNHVYIKYLQGKRSSNAVFKLLHQLQETPKLEYLFVRDGESDLLPARLIQQSPLRHLRLDPRIFGSRHDMNFKKLPISWEILEKRTLEHLTLGLTREWYTPGKEVHGCKYLPALKTLWLNLTTFKPESCCDLCPNICAHSWTCSDNKPRPSYMTRKVETDCQRRSPTAFLQLLDHPELSLLNIKFPVEATGNMFLDVISAANSNCQLRNLTELSLAGGGWFMNCGECGQRPRPNIMPAHLHSAMNILLPLPRLKTLRLTVAPNYLDVLDLELYASIANGLPALERLFLGHAQFCTSSLFQGTRYYEKIPLHHLAAFCTMLPNLSEVSIGTLDVSVVEEIPRKEWASFGVKSLQVQNWFGLNEASDDLRARLHLGLQTYFPQIKFPSEISHRYTPFTSE